LSKHLLQVLDQAGAIVYGMDDPADAAGRVPTICFNIPGSHPARVVEHMADCGFGIRDGHMYAPRLMQRLGLALDSGAVRVSLVHYNTLDEIDRFAEALRKLVH
jgi:selenocysteine lyase/cysteine desulfurase